MSKTRHLTEIEKSIVLSHADYEHFAFGGTASCPACRSQEALIGYSMCEGSSFGYVDNINELALYLDSVTVEVE